MKEIVLACRVEILSSDLHGFDLLADLQDCSGYLYPGFGAGVATVRTGSVGGIPPQQALLLRPNPSWPAGSKDAAAAVAVKGLVGDPS